MKSKETIIRKRIQTKKVKRDQLTKNALITITSLFIVFIISFIFILISKGISAFFVFDNFSLMNFLFGNYYNPSSLAFSSGFMIINTLWISFLSLLIAVPVSVLTALFIVKIIPKAFKSTFVIVISILAAIPSVIYGAFGMFIINGIISTIFNVPPGVAISVVVTLSFMIMPTITILSISSLEGVDRKLQESSIALGATKIQTSIHITLRSASKGILVAILLGLGRAIGEATAVSMVASQSSYGPTFSLFSFTTLITATMLQGFQEVASGSLEQSSMFAMASLLLVTILIVFSGMKILEIKIDLENRSKKAYKKIKQKKFIKKKVEEQSVKALTKKEFKEFSKEILYERRLIEEKEHWELSYEIATIKLHNSYYGNKNKRATKFKNKRTLLGNLFIVSFSMIGIFILLSIVSFLFFGGFKVLNFKYLSTSGIFTIVDGQQVYGLATPLFGTLLTIIIALTLSLSIGLLIAITTSIYIKKNTKFSYFISLMVQVLTGIPSLIYGIIGTIIFVPLFSNNFIHLNSFSAAFTISLFVLPTILKTTQEGFDSIPSSQKDASLALGGTNWITTKKVLLKQALPSIVSSAVVAIGMIIADSAIFITIYGSISQSSASEWIKSGGTTLASEIYKLTRQEVILWEYVKAIGIVIVFLILLFSTIANFIKTTKYTEAIILFVGIIIMFFGIFEAIFSIFIIGIVIVIFAIIFLNLFKRIDQKFNIIEKIKIRYFSYMGGI